MKYMKCQSVKRLTLCVSIKPPDFGLELLCLATAPQHRAQLNLHLSGLQGQAHVEGDCEPTAQEHRWNFKENSHTDSTAPRMGTRTAPPPPPPPSPRRPACQHPRLPSLFRMCPGYAPPLPPAPMLGNAKGPRPKIPALTAWVNGVPCPVERSRRARGPPAGPSTLHTPLSALHVLGVRRAGNEVAPTPKQKQTVQCKCQTWAGTGDGNPPALHSTLTALAAPCTSGVHCKLGGFYRRPNNAPQRESHGPLLGDAGKNGDTREGAPTTERCIRHVSYAPPW